VGTDDPIEQVSFIADQGFAGVQDPMATERSEADQSRIGEAAAERGLDVGCFVYRHHRHTLEPMAWGAFDEDARQVSCSAMRECIEVAKRLGSRHIAILSARNPVMPKWIQLSTMAENLRPVADIASAAGVTIVLEATDAQRLPGLLLNHLSEAATVARMTGHPGVRLVFDTAHVQAMDGNLIGNLREVFDLVELVQIADHPGRGEPGSGEINFESIFLELHRLKFAGLCELEHLWTRPGREAEAAGLAELRRLDTRAAARASTPSTSD